MIKPLDFAFDYPGVQRTKYWAWRYNLQRAVFKCQVSGAGQTTVKSKCLLYDTVSPFGLEGCNACSRWITVGEGGGWRAFSLTLREKFFR
jgi:hypothetical protein